MCAVQDEARSLCLDYSDSGSMGLHLYTDCCLAKIFHDNPRIGFLAHAEKYQDAVIQDIVLAPARSIGQMQQVIFNDYINVTLTALFMAVLISILMFGIRTILQARIILHPTTREAPFELLPAYASIEK